MKHLMLLPVFVMIMATQGMSQTLTSNVIFSGSYLDLKERNGTGDLPVGKKCYNKNFGPGSVTREYSTLTASKAVTYAELAIKDLKEGHNATGFELKQTIMNLIGYQGGYVVISYRLPVAALGESGDNVYSWHVSAYANSNLSVSLKGYRLYYIQ